MGRSPYLGSARYLRRPVIAPKVNSCLCWAPSCTSRDRGGGSFPAPGSPTGFASTRRRCRGLSWSPLPAGFGKTTLMRSGWRRVGATGSEPAGPPPRVAWLSLDAGDSDLRRFLTHLVAADPDEQPSRWVRRRWRCWTTGRALPAEDVLVSLVNDLDELAGPTVLALDDYHVIDAPDVHEAVTFLLDHLPPQVTLAITTRADPPLPLARLRARGELLELRAADLRFTADEADAFLNDVMGLDLEPAHVAALEPAPRDGPPDCSWPPCRPAAAPAPATLRGGAASSTRSPAATASSWTTWSRRCSNSQPDDVRAFLLDTSVLQQLTGRCATRSPAATTAARRCWRPSSAANLFVVPLDDQRQWYRYHHLFADALRARLVCRAPRPGPRSCTRPPAAGTPSTGCWPTPSGMRSPAATTSTPRTWSSSALADLRRRRAGPHASGLAARRCRRTSSGAGRCSPAAWRGPALRGRPRRGRGVARRRRGGPRHGRAPLGRGARVSPGPAGRRRPRQPGRGARTARSRPRSRSTAPSVAQARGDVDGTVAHARRALALAGPGGPPRAQWRRRLPRPGGMGRRRPPDRRGHVRARRSRSLHAAGMIADELGGTVVAGRHVAGPRPARPRPAGCTSARWRRPTATPARCSPAPATCTSASRTCCASRATSTGRGAPRARAGARRPRVAAGEPAPLVHGDGRTAAGAR